MALQYTFRTYLYILYFNTLCKRTVLCFSVVRRIYRSLRWFSRLANFHFDFKIPNWDLPTQLMPILISLANFYLDFKIPNWDLPAQLLPILIRLSQWFSSHVQVCMHTRTK